MPHMPNTRVSMHEGTCTSRPGTHKLWWLCPPAYAAACLYHIAPLAGSVLTLQHQLVLAPNRRNDCDDSHAVDRAMPGLALRRLPEAQPAASALAYAHMNRLVLESATNMCRKSASVSRYASLHEARSQQSTLLCPNAQAAPSCLVLVLRAHVGSQQHFSISEAVATMPQSEKLRRTVMRFKVSHLKPEGPKSSLRSIVALIPPRA